MSLRPQLRRAAALSWGTRGAPLPFSFAADLLSSAVLNIGVGAPTFNRASVAVVRDQEGLLQTAISGETRFVGARRVRNILTSPMTSENFTTWSANFAGTGTSPVVTAGFADPLGGTTACRLQADRGAGITGGDYSFINGNIAGNPTICLDSVWMKSNTGSSQTLKVDIGTGPTVTVTTSWQRFAVSKPFSTYFGIGAYGPDGGTQALDILLWRAMAEDSTGKANQNPSEYVGVGAPVLNELVRTEEPASVAWDAAAGGSTKTVVNGPDGLAVAGRIALGANAVSGAAYALRFTGVAPRVITSGSPVSVSVWIRKISGSGTQVNFNPQDGLGGNKTIDANWQKYTAENIATAVGIAPFFDIELGGLGWTAADIIEFWHPQMNIGTTVNAYSPVSGVYPFYGAMVDGVRYFETQNGNTLSGAGVVTEATGAAIPLTTLLGYLPEEARTNLVLQSENQVATWVANSTTLGSNVYTAPSGYDNADSVTGFNAAATHFQSQAITFTAVIHTFSIYLKYINHTWAALRVFDGTNSYFASFNLLNGTAGAVSASTTSTITNEGAGWYRVSITTPALLAAAGTVAVGLNDADSASFTTWTPAGTETIAVWGAQLEAAPVARSYIPTLAATVTRASDNLSYFTLGNTNGLLGFAYAETFAPAVLAASNPRIIGNAGAGAPTPLSIVTGNGFLSAWDGTTSSDASSGDMRNGQHKAASKWQDAVGKSVFMDGILRNSVGTANDILDGPNISIGLSPYLNGPIRKIRFGTVLPTDAQLRLLTA